MQVEEKVKTQILCPVKFSRKRAAYKIMWKKYGTAGESTDDKITRRMRFAYWRTKATNGH